MTISDTKKANGRGRWGMFLMATSVLSVVPNAMAQQAPGALDEIIVTATKRAENLQDVPISVQAIGAERLEQLNVSDFADYAKLLPSLSYSATYGPGYNRPFIRGVASGENGNHSGPLPSVGTYLDEQPITTITGNLDLHIYDIARVEVLAGPQGTLYGASSQSGTVRIISNQPDSSGFSASVDIEGNTIKNGAEGGGVEGYVNIPLSERAAIRLVGWAEHEGGYIDNVAGTRLYPTSGVLDNNNNRAEEDYNDVETTGLRAALRIDLNDNWTVTPQIMAQSQISHGVFASDPLVGDLAVTHYFPEFNKDKWVQAALTVEGEISDLDVVFATSYLKRDVDSNQDYADYGYFYDVLLGYGSYFTDNSGNPINPAQQVEGRDKYERQTYELRVSTPAENRLRAIGGLFYQSSEHRIHQRYILDGFRDAHEVPGNTDTIWLTEQLRTDEDSAVFGELSFDITDKLTATGGVRVFRAENSLEGYFGFSAAFGAFYGVPTLGEASCFAPSRFAGAPCTNLDKSTSESGESYRANLQYKFDGDRMVYATYSEGFRPGGINRRGTLAPYVADFLTNYEAGWKTEWADGRLRWNGAVFFEQWEDFQFSFLGGSGLTEIQNAGNAEIKGIESDIVWAAAEGLTLTASATYLDSELVETSVFAPSGTPLPVAPDVKASASARYEFMLGDWNSFVQGSASYNGESTVDLRPVESALIGTLPSYWLVDASAGVERNGYRFSLYVDNLFDERAIGARYTECAIGTCFGQPYDVVSKPLTFGVRLGRKY